MASVLLEEQVVVPKDVESCIVRSLSSRGSEHENNNMPRGSGDGLFIAGHKAEVGCFDAWVAQLTNSSHVFEERCDAVH